MKVLAIVALAAVATAIPAELVKKHHKPSGGGDCSIEGDNNGSVHCCESGGILSGLLCNVLALGETCDSGQHVYCCENNSGGLINLNLLNCVNL